MRVGRMLHGRAIWRPRVISISARFSSAGGHGVAALVGVSRVAAASKSTSAKYHSSLSSAARARRKMRRKKPLMRASRKYALTGTWARNGRHGAMYQCLALTDRLKLAPMPSAQRRKLFLLSEACRPLGRLCIRSLSSNASTALLSSAVIKMSACRGNRLAIESGGIDIAKLIMRH